MAQFHAILNSLLLPDNAVRGEAERQLLAIIEENSFNALSLLASSIQDAPSLQVCESPVLLLFHSLPSGARDGSCHL
jgi:hypothetical protein